MESRTAQGPVAASEDRTPQPLQSGRRLRRPGAIAMFLAALAIILVACGGGGSGEADDKMPSVSTGTEIGISELEDLAPNFSVTLYQGEGELGAQEVELAQLRGKPVVLNFWAGLCPPCRAEMPDLQEFYEGYKDRVTLLGVDLGQFTGLGNRQDAEELLEELGVSYAAGFTNDTGVVKDYSILGMPTTVFIDAQGRIFKSWTGALNRATLEKETNKLLSQ